MLTCNGKKTTYQKVFDKFVNDGFATFELSDSEDKIKFALCADARLNLVFAIKTLSFTMRYPLTVAIIDGGLSSYQKVNLHLHDGNFTFNVDKAFNKFGKMFEQYYYKNIVGQS